MRDFDLLLFDCDGVLVDSERMSARCVAESLQDAGYGIDEASVLDRFMGLTHRSMCEIIERETGCPLPAGFVDDLRGRLQTVADGNLRPIRGVAEAIGRLPLPCCVASSSHPDRVRRYLEITGLADRFGRHVFSAAMVERGKPAPDLFLFAAEKMGARPNRCLVVEDSKAGVQAGKAAGMTVFGFTGGSHVTSAVHGPALAALGADLVFDSMADLPDLLQCAGPTGRVPLRRVS